MLVPWLWLHLPFLYLSSPSYPLRCLCCITNYHTISSLRQHIVLFHCFSGSQFQAQLSWVFRILHMPTIKMSAASSQVMTGKSWLPGLRGCWQNSVPYWPQTKGVSFLLVAGQRPLSFPCHTNLSIQQLKGRQFASTKPAHEMLAKACDKLVSLNHGRDIPSPLLYSLG